MIFEGRPVSRRAATHPPGDPAGREGRIQAFSCRRKFFEQPHAVRDTLLGRFSLERRTGFSRSSGFTDAEIAALRGGQNRGLRHQLACRGWAGQVHDERLAGLPRGGGLQQRIPLIVDPIVTVGRAGGGDSASSGETADTLAALREAETKRRAHSADLAIASRLHEYPRGWRHAAGLMPGRKSGSPPPSIYCQLTFCVLLASTSRGCEGPVDR